MKLHTSSLIRIIKSLPIEINRGAEVGVYRGEASKDLIQAFPYLKLYMIDIWSDSFTTDKRLGGASQKVWNEIREQARQNGVDSEGYQRGIIWQARSIEAAVIVVDHYFDFVFIDADHRYEQVQQDIQAWYPKVKVGGLLCGHDYDGKNDRRGIWGVKRAVDEAFGDRVLTDRGLIWGVIKT